MTISSLTKTGSFCRLFLQLLREGRLTNVWQVYDFELDEVVLIGTIA